MPNKSRNRDNDNLINEYNNKYNKNFSKKRKSIDAIKRGETRGQIDDIIHNSSYCQSNSAFLTEF